MELPTTSELVGQYIQSREELRRAPNTMDWYRWVLLPYARSMPDHPTSKEIQTYLATAPSAESARNWLRALRAMYAWAADWLDYPNPARRVMAPQGKRRLPRVFSQSELNRIFAVAGRDPVNIAALTVLLDTGVRIGELASIKVEHIDPPRLEGAPAAILVDGKTGQRRVPASPETVRALMRIAPTSGPVFMARKGPTRPMHVTTLELRVRECIRLAGITGQKVGPHTLRHTFATLYLREGGDLHRLQRILGHSRITQTMVYLHLSDPEAFAEHARLSPLRLLGACDDLEDEDDGEVAS